MNVGADLLADAFVFGVGIAIVLFEFDRSSRKDAAKVTRSDVGAVLSVSYGVVYLCSVSLLFVMEHRARRCRSDSKA